MNVGTRNNRKPSSFRGCIILTHGQIFLGNNPQQSPAISGGVWGLGGGRRVLGLDSTCRSHCPRLGPRAVVGLAPLPLLVVGVLPRRRRSEDPGVVHGIQPQMGLKSPPPRRRRRTPRGFKAWHLGRGSRGVSRAGALFLSPRRSACQAVGCECWPHCRPDCLCATGQNT